MDIRKLTGIIIEKDGMYLVGRCPVTGSLLWRDSPYDAWRTRRRDKAFIVADRVNGRRFLFNPASGERRMMTWKSK